MIPLLKAYPATLSACNAFSDQYVDGIRWKPYEREADRGKRFWLGCLVTADRNVVVEAIDTSSGSLNVIFVGYGDQRSVEKVKLAKGATEMISTPVQPCSCPHGTCTRMSFTVQLSDGTLLPPECMHVDQACNRR